MPTCIEKNIFVHQFFIDCKSLALLKSQNSCCVAIAYGCNLPFRCSISKYVSRFRDNVDKKNLTSIYYAHKVMQMNIQSIHCKLHGTIAFGQFIEMNLLDKGEVWNFHYINLTVWQWLSRRLHTGSALLRMDWIPCLTKR